MSTQKTIYSICQNNYWKKKAAKLKIKGPIHFIQANQKSSEKEIDKILIEVLAANKANIPFVTIDEATSQRQKAEIKKTCKEMDLIDDLCTIFFTSGTTNQRKPIQWNNQGIINFAKATAKRFGLNRKTIFTNSQPVLARMFFDEFLWFCCAKAKKKIYIDKSLDYSQLVQKLIKWKIGLYVDIGHNWEKISEILEIKNLKLNLTAIIVGSKPNKKTLDSLLTRTKKVILTYGLTEVGAACYTAPKKGTKYGCVGKATPGAKIKVLRPSGKECSPFEKGEVVFSGKFVSPSVSNPYFTGDIGYKDKDGDLFLIGRKDDQIKVKGRRVNISQIESAYDKYKNCVFGISDKIPEWQELVIIFETSDSINKLQKYINQTSPPVIIHCRPKYVFKLKKFPQTSTGKIDRQKIKKYFSTKLNKKLISKLNKF